MPVSVTPPSASISSSGLVDGLGRRLLAFDRETGAIFERLALRPELGAFESAIRRRVGDFAALADERFACPRSVERDETTGELAVISPFVEGSRLSDVLEAAEDLSLVPGSTTAFGFLLDALAALSSFHAALGSAHGLIDPTRIVIAHDGRLVFLDPVFATVLERLMLSRARLWSEFGIAALPDAGPVRLNQAGDVAQVALSALMLLIGRRLRNSDDPDALPALLTEVARSGEMRTAGVTEEVQRIFERLLPLPHRTPVASAEEARIEVEQFVRREKRLLSCRDALPAFVRRIEASLNPGAAILSAAAPSAPQDLELDGSPDDESFEIDIAGDGGVLDDITLEVPFHPPPSEAAPTVPRTAVTTGVKASPDLAALPGPRPAPPARDAAPDDPVSSDPPRFPRRPTYPPVTLAAAAIPANPPDAPTPRLETSPKPQEGNSPRNRTDGPEQPVGTASRQPTSWKMALVVLLTLTLSILLGHDFLPSHSAAGGEPVLQDTVETLAPPEPEQLPSDEPEPRAGQLAIETQPAGIRVLLNDEYVGETPLKVPGVAPGRHVLTFVSPTGKVSRDVEVTAGETLTVDAPVLSGRVAILAPVVLDVEANGQRIGTSESNRLMLPPGRHELTMSNRELRYRAVRIVEVAPGQVRTVSLDPRGVANINALPWAEVRVGDQLLGETPLANVPVSLGVQEFLFKHPQHGERRVTQIIRADQPSAISVDLTRPATR